MIKTNKQILKDLQELAKAYLHWQNGDEREEAFNKNLITEDWKIKSNLSILQLQELIEILDNSYYKIWDIHNKDIYLMYQGFETTQYTQYKKALKEINNG